MKNGMYILTFGLIILFLILGYFLYSHFNNQKKNSFSGLEKANVFVEYFGKQAGASDAKLGEDNDRAFGEFGFHYYPEKNSLQGRVFVANALIKTASVEGQENYRKMLLALKDPRKGGMFDQGGGYFLLDEEKEKFFLVKDYDLSRYSVQDFKKDFENLINLGATWTIRWFAKVALIMHGHEIAPDHFITRENDPELK